MSEYRTIILLLCIMIANYIIWTCISFYLYRKRIKDADNKAQQDNSIIKQKPLTPEQIRDIHAKGKITPEEKATEWESLDLCVPGDIMEKAYLRCRKYDNCHECLMDYAAELNSEFSSMYGSYHNIY